MSHRWDVSSVQRWRHNEDRGMSLQTASPLSSTLTICTDLSVTYWLTSPVALCSVFLAGISFWIHSTNSVVSLILYAYNFEATTMRPLVIATLASCVKWPLIHGPTAATKLLAVRSSMCGFNIRNMCHRHFKNAADCRNQQHSSCAIWNECGEDCLLL